MNTETNVSPLVAASETSAATDTGIGPMPAPKAAPRKVGKAAKRAAKAAATDDGATSTDAPTKAAKAGKQIELKVILKELKLDGKLARRKLRAAKLDFHGHRERWLFTPKQAAKVREILTK